ncbi:mucoidy inhibitor MuiA family protein [Lacipirellula sp.]|uniref:mucoidy inhibitor MuiA family protein n=1 Tax=Lacipirellula sp. TaxID=2691419 RepID=UPI003D0BD992
MFRSTLMLVLVGSSICWSSTPSARASSAVEGRVTEVTLYRGQAQITRTVPIDGAAGRREVVVSNLPEQIVPNSLFAEGGDAVEIRAVRFRTRAVGEEPREEVRKLDDEILAAQQELDLTTKRQALLVKRTEYLAKLEGFIAPTAQSDLTKGVLDAEALERLTTFDFAQHETIATEEVELAKQARTINERLELLNRKRAEITAGASQTIREAVLFVQKQAEAPTEIRLSYLVSNCGWSPSYAMRAAADGKQVRVEYNALIQQLSGEDWNDVELTLSTASPALSAAGPGLAPLHVMLASDAQLADPFGAQVAANGPANGGEQAPQQTEAYFGRGLSKSQVLGKLEGLQSQKQEYSNAVGNAGNFVDVNRFSWNLNDVASNYQQLELNGDATTLSVLRSEANGDSDGPSLSYRLGSGVSLASRTDQQMVRIMQTDMESQFYHVAVPVLTSYVYREAELKNTSDEDLLAGPMTAYLDGRFVGKGELPTVARGQKFVVGFGANPQLRARRELVDKSDSVQGGNRETRFEYRLVVENFSDQATPIRVIDRLPHAEHGADIRITLGETSDKVSEDALYVREERPMGLLRWDVEAPADAAGEAARLITYKYAVEYDRKFVVSAPSSKDTLQEEFERLQRDRQKR